MKTVDAAISLVYAVLKDEENGLGVPVYKYKKPTKLEHDEFVVINSLPINTGVLQKCIVNVNYYAKDLAPGIPDTPTLESGSSSVLGLLDGFSGSGSVVDFEQHQIEWDYASSRHYSNLRFSVKLIN